MFIPGETIMQSFTIPYPIDTIDKVIVSYRQKDRIVLEKIITSKKNMESTEDDETIVNVVIKESESMLFEDNCRYGVQVNLFFTDENGLAGRATSYEVYGETGLQHIRDVGKNATNAGMGTLTIDDDGYLVWIYETSSVAFAIDNDGFLVVEREVV